MIAETLWTLPCNQSVSTVFAVVIILGRFEHRSWFHWKHQRRMSIRVSNFGVRRVKINEICGTNAAKYTNTVSPNNHRLWLQWNVRNFIISISETTEGSPLIKLQLTLPSLMYYFPTNIYRFKVVNNSAPPLGVILNQFCISTSSNHRIILDKFGKGKTKILAAVGNLT